MLKVQYPSLYQALTYPNFEKILETFENHFPFLLNLSLLEEAFKNKQQGSYVLFFTKLMSALNTPDCNSEKSIYKKIHHILHTDNDIRAFFLEKLLFVPHDDGEPSVQLAFHERLATQKHWLAVESDITYLDMHRIVQYLAILRKEKANFEELDIPPVAIINLESFNEEEATLFIQQNRALLVNLNSDLKAPAKWAFINLENKAKPILECEALLLESERKALEKFGVTLEIISKGTSSLVSTGYVAIRRFDEEITAAVFSKVDDKDADFNIILTRFFHAMFRMGKKPVTLSCVDNEFETYVNPLLQDLDDKRWHGKKICSMIPLSLLGTLEGEKIPLNDMITTLEIVAKKKLSQAQIDEHTLRVSRTNIPAFLTVITNMGVKGGNIEEKSDAVSLLISDTISIDPDMYGWKVDKSDLTPIKRDFKNPMKVNEDFVDKDIASAIILTLFRSKAKKASIAITLPAQFDVTDEEQTQIVTLMQDNAHVMEFVINEDNISLKVLKEKLTPVLARNRWLKLHGYLPPLVDNFWLRAAMYCLSYLNEHPYILQERKKHAHFFNAMSDMGVDGLDAILNVLNNPHRLASLETMYGKQKPAFYLAASKEKLNACVMHLTDHLKNKSAFPFSKLVMPCYLEADQAFIELFTFLDKETIFDAVWISDFSKDLNAGLKFIQKMIELADKQQWRTLLVIPELTDDSLLGEAHRELRLQYRLLNDTILMNRQIKQGQIIVERIKKVSLVSEVFEEKNEVKGSDNILDEKTPKSWPLHRGNTQKLQMQQQQELQQMRQVQQEQVEKPLDRLDGSLHGDLVTYDNIDKLLRPYYEQLKQEGFKITLKGSLWPAEVENNWRNNETELQTLFRTWIGANPTVKVPHIISSMTLDAAKMMLRHFAKLTSSLKVSNPPAGFYTQPAVTEDGLILGYNPEIGLVHGYRTPLTVDLTHAMPKAEFWMGDFRLFDIPFYASSPELIKKEDFEWLMLFEALQPTKDYSADYHEFCLKNPTINIAHKEAFIKKHWLLFLQTWEYGGGKAIEMLLSVEPVALNKEKTFKALLGNAKLSHWLMDVNGELNPKVLVAIGQIYYFYRSDAVVLFLSKLEEARAKLGDEFMHKFYREILGRMDSFAPLMTPSFFNMMDAMIGRFSRQKSETLKKAWLTCCICHLDVVADEPIEVIWAAFEHFMTEISVMELTLKVKELENLTPQNILVGFDNILDSLRVLPTHAFRVNFLSSVSSLHLMNGGVHYAIQHNDYVHCDKGLQLLDFNNGNNSAKSYVQEKNLYSSQVTTLQLKRLIASKMQVNLEIYQFLCQKIDDTENAPSTRNALLDKLFCCLFTQYETNVFESLFQQLDNIHKTRIKIIASAFCDAVIDRGHEDLLISFESVLLLLNSSMWVDIDKALDQHKHGNFLESVTILVKKQEPEALKNVIELFGKSIAKPESYPEWLYQISFKLAALFGDYEPAHIKSFIEATTSIQPQVMTEINQLLSQLLSVDYVKMNEDKTWSVLSWKSLFSCIDQMILSPNHAAHLRKTLILELKKAGAVFTHADSDEVSLLTLADYPLNAMNVFVAHKERLWKFLQKHMVISRHKPVLETLLPILSLLKTMELNRTYLNELEPLLGILETVAVDEYWTAEYFSQLLYALRPTDAARAFPFDMLSVLLTDELTKARPIDNIEKVLPKSLKRILQQIVAITELSSSERAALTRLALMEYRFSHANPTIQRITDLLIQKDSAKSREPLCLLLGKSKTQAELLSCLKVAETLYEKPDNQSLKKSWDKATALWLRALADNDALMNYHQSIQSDECKEKRQFIQYIMAFSTLALNGRSHERYAHDLKNKGLKLIETLKTLSLNDLLQLTTLYPATPSPSTDALRRIIKKSQQDGLQLNDGLDKFLKKPHESPRADYRQITKTREVDLTRMFDETLITDGNKIISLNPEQIRALQTTLGVLKWFESGDMFLEGINYPISSMSQIELKEHFYRLSQIKDSEEAQIQIWAIIFEVMGRTTGKYPQLAQQFSILANDLCLKSKTHVVQLGTGEGKSHYAAMRAASYAGQGNVVDLCSVKRPLAIRDVEDYRSFFEYLGINVSYIHAKSSRADYVDAEYPENPWVHYTILGDLSLFFDAQAFEGNPIQINRKNRVGLLDEIDFMYFDEGATTQFNYARSSGQLPKQMMWFYDAVNEFVEKHQFTNSQILKSDLKSLITFLTQKAGGDENKCIFLDTLKHDIKEQVYWLQSGVETASLMKEATQATFLQSEIKVGDAIYPVKEITPLSIDMQKTVGATFCHGVQQLWAAKMNSLAKQGLVAQNYHVHPESHVLSSKTAAKHLDTEQGLWGRWEGFTGSISSQQSDLLKQSYGTQVLEAATNQKDLRDWQEPVFYDDDKVRMDALAQSIKACFKEPISFFIATKNYLTAKAVKAALRTRLTSEEFQHLIFNADDGSLDSELLLRQKKQMEKVKDGKIIQSVGLCDPSFGRGENLQVGCVFLLDALTVNEKIQKGGRTARQGDEGKVVSFYLTPSLEKEEKLLLNTLLTLLPSEKEVIQKALTSVEGKSAHEKLLSRVELLKEYVLIVEQIKNEPYSILIAQFSDWGMNYLSQCKEENLNHLSQAFAKQLKFVEEFWQDLKNNHPDDSEHLQLLADFMSKVAKELISQSKLNHIPELLITIPKVKKIHFDWDVSKKTLSISDKNPIENFVTYFFDESAEPFVRHHIEKGIKNDREKRMRLLTQVEVLANESFVKEDNKSFIESFVIILSLNDSKEATLLLTQLVKKTSEWWLRGDGIYQKELIYLWQKFSESKSPAIESQLHDKMSLQGKIWFQEINMMFQMNFFEPLTENQWRKIRLIFIKTSKINHSMGQYFNIEMRDKALMYLGKMLPDLIQCNRLDDFLEKFHDFLIEIEINPDAVAEMAVWYLQLNVICESAFDVLDQYLNSEFREGSFIEKMHTLKDASLDDKAVKAFLGILKIENSDNGFTHGLNGICFITSCVAEEKITKDTYSRILALPSEKLYTLMDIFSESEQYHQLVNSKPELLSHLLAYAEMEISAKRLEMLARLLLSLTLKHQKVKDNVNYFALGLTRFATEAFNDEDVIALTTLLEEGNGFSPENIIFDDGLLYLNKHVGRKDYKIIKTAVSNFYSKAQQDNLSIDAFGFERNRKNKIILMHALNQGAFIHKDDAAKPEGIFNWTSAHNASLLDAGYDKYLARTHEILDANVDKPKLRDLTANQQLYLLHLSDEMKVIGQPKLAKICDDDDSVNKLQQRLQTLEQTYAASWFKSTARKTELKKLHVLTNNVWEKKESSCRYEKVLTALQELRNQAIENDRLLENKGSKVHRDGNSRYLTTLNHMEDAVLSHWVKDKAALPHFHMYKENAKTELMGIVNDFSKLIETHYKRCYEGNGFWKKLLRKGDNYTHIKALRTSVSEFTKADLTVSALEKFSDSLMEHSTQCSGHIQTLGWEVSIRMTIFNNYLNMLNEDNVEDMALRK